MCNILNFVIFFSFLVFSWVQFLGFFTKSILSFVIIWVFYLHHILIFKFMSQLGLFLALSQSEFLSFISTPYFLFHFFSSTLSTFIAQLFGHCLLMLENIFQLHLAHFLFRFSFSCTWPSLFTEKISCLLSLSCLSQWDGCQ